MTVQPGWQACFYKNFAIGDTCQNPLGRTITETNNTWPTES